MVIILIWTIKFQELKLLHSYVSLIGEACPKEERGLGKCLFKEERGLCAASPKEERGLGGTRTQKNSKLAAFSGKNINLSNGVGQENVWRESSFWEI